jgi:hypothetical protein
MTLWHDHTSVTGQKSNSGLIAEQSREGINDFSIDDSNVYIQSLQQTTGSNPFITYSFNFSTSPFNFIENMDIDNDSPVLVESQASHLLAFHEFQPVQSNVSTVNSSMSFPSQSSHHDMPRRFLTSSLPTSVPAMSLSQSQSQSQPQSQLQPIQPQPQFQSQPHSQPPTDSQHVTTVVMPTVTDRMVQSVHIPPQSVHVPSQQSLSSRSLVSPPDSVSTNHGLYQNHGVTLSERQGPIFENPGSKSPIFSDMSRSRQVRTADQLFLQNQGHALMHSDHTAPVVPTASTDITARRQGLFHQHGSDPSSESDDADSDPSSDSPPPDRTDEQAKQLLFLEIWNWPTLLISGCMYDVYGSLSKPLPSCTSCHDVSTS